MTIGRYLIAGVIKHNRPRHQKMPGFTGAKPNGCERFPYRRIFNEKNLDWSNIIRFDFSGQGSGTLFNNLVDIITN